MADIKFKYATEYDGCTTSEAYIVNIRNLGDNDHVEEEYVYTREELLTLNIESTNKYIAQIEQLILRYRGLLNSTEYSEGLTSRELRKFERRRIRISIHIRQIQRKMPINTFVYV
jgi:hypothetical protein